MVPWIAMHHCDNKPERMERFYAGLQAPIYADPFSLRISLIVKHKRKLKMMESIDMVDTVIG